MPDAVVFCYVPDFCRFDRHELKNTSISVVVEAPSSSLWAVEYANMILSVSLNTNITWKFGPAVVDLSHRLRNIYGEKIVQVEKSDQLCHRKLRFCSLS